MALTDQLAALSDEKRAIIAALQSGVSERIGDILDELIDLLDLYIADQNALTLGQLASLNQLNDLIELVQLAGLQAVEQDTIAAVSRVSDKIAQQLTIAGLSPAQTTLDETALRSYVTFKVREVTDQFAREVAGRIQSAWVDSTFTGQPLKKAIADATAFAIGELRELTPSQVSTHVGTAVSSIDRSITAQLESDDDTIVYVYIGPNDPLVRKTCQRIVGKYATKDQIARLDNGQIPNVLVTGGGWNCRHSWAPILRVAAEKAGILAVTEFDILAFNAYAQKRKKKKV